MAKKLLKEINHSAKKVQVSIGSREPTTARAVTALGRRIPWITSCHCRNATVEERLQIELALDRIIAIFADPKPSPEHQLEVESIENGTTKEHRDGDQ